MISLPDLTFKYDALEPFIDKKTMEIHHKKHHQAYIDRLNSVLSKYPKTESTSVATIMNNISTLPFTEEERKIVRNNGGGHLNHSFFWTILGKTKKIDSALTHKIMETYGSIDVFKEEFSKRALSLFGSGWVWLVEDDTHMLHLYTTPNQDSPYLSGHIPLIGLDLWEHAYYLRYQNNKSEYIKNWWNVLMIIN